MCLFYSNKTDFNSIGGGGGGGGRVVVNFCRRNRGWGAILLKPTFCKFGTPISKKMITPLTVPGMIIIASIRTSTYYFIC